METIKQVLIRRDNMTAEEASDLINEAIETMDDYIADNDLESAYNICSEYFGLEPDYLDELI